MLNLREIRIEKGMQQKDLAAAVGVSRVRICNYEKGYREPNLQMLRKLAAVLGCSIDRLVGNEQA